MTVGISVNSKDKAVVTTDSRVSTWTRQSDAVEKSGTIDRDNYNLIIFGTGEANTVFSIIKNLNQHPGDTLDEYVNGLKSHFRTTIEQRYDNNITTGHKNLIHKARTITMQDYAKTLEHVTKALGMSKEEQEAYIKKEQERLLRKHETYIEEELEAIKREVDRDMRQRQTLFGIVAYDRQQQKIRHFTMDINELAESHEDHLEIGSGRDGAEFYLTNKLQGVTPAHLEAHELAYFTMNAYCQSTMNQGVGGTPKIHIIGDQSKELSKKQAISLNNLCGAHMADANPRILTPEHTISIIKGILADDAAAYERGAEATRLNPHTFTEIAIPYNALQASSNAALFKK